MKKRINIDRLRAQVTLGYAGIGLALTKWLKDQPEDPNGVLIDTEVVSEGLWDIADGVLIPFINKTVRENMPGSVDPIDPTDLDKDPLEPPPDPDPDPNNKYPGWKEFTVAACDESMTYRHNDESSGTRQEKCLFRDFSSCEQMPDKFRIVWIDANGNEETLDVRGKCSNAMGSRREGFRKYRHIDDKKPHPVAYAPRGFKAVKAIVLVPESDTTPQPDPDYKPEEPSQPEDEWVTIRWEGDQSLGYGGHDSRDRTWWTKIHGSHSTPWSRKFPLPKRVESARNIRFKFSDGSELYVPNPRKMAMNHGGPKYRPEEPGEGDSRKQHPKVGAIPKSPVTWVKYKAVY